MSALPELTFAPRHELLIACDSDGCVFDVMDLKHCECFCPAFIKHFGLQRCSRQARLAWEFANLRGRTRGTNRFKAVGLALDLLMRHREVAGAGLVFMDFTCLREFLAKEKTLGEPALIRACAETGDGALAAMLAWTREVNVAVAEMCRGLGPFPGVAAALRGVANRADLMVVSQAPRKTLVEEWTHSGLAADAVFIGGQEYGSKAEQIRKAMAGRYRPGQILVLGDAPGDREAAAEVGAWFYPIMPGCEIDSWRRFDEAFARLVEGRWDAAWQAGLDAEFGAALPEIPAWL